jgi:putative SOS response-associated peptidase YedK
MCGRYTLACPDEESLIRGLPFDEFSEIRIEFRPRYNIAPGQKSPVVCLEEGNPVLVDGVWGFARSGGGSAINARMESAERSASFRDAFRDGRCLVPADGFLEWRKEGRVNQPYLFRHVEGRLLLMAGLREGGCFVILTEDSKGDVAEIHDRMPVLLDHENARRWLQEGKLRSTCELARAAVSSRVNRTEHDDPSCLAPVAQSTFDFG